MQAADTTVTLAWIGLATSAVTGVLMIINTIITSRTKEEVTILKKNTDGMQSALTEASRRAGVGEGFMRAVETSAVMQPNPVVAAPADVLSAPTPVVVVNKKSQPANVQESPDASPK